MLEMSQWFIYNFYFFNFILKHKAKCAHPKRY